MLTIRGLSKTYCGNRTTPPVAALDSVDLDVAEGQFATVLGPSGCGKSTLLRSVAGFETPDAGTVVIGDRTVADAGRRRCHVPAHARGTSIVPQDGALFPHLSVAQNVGFGLTALRGRARSRRIREVLELVGLDGLGSRRPHELSGGQQQRVTVARAVAPGPRVVLLDEPFSALDAHLRQSLRTEVRDLLRAIGSTVVLVTHDQSEALTMADHLVVMRDGRVVQSGSPQETYGRPRDIELARFLGDAVVVDGDIPPGNGTAPTTVRCPFGTLPIESWHGGSGPCDVLIRPENIHILRESASSDGLAGTVVSRSFFGHDGLLRVQVPQLLDQVPVRVMGELPFAPGETVRLVVDRPVCTYPS